MAELNVERKYARRKDWGSVYKKREILCVQLGVSRESIIFSYHPPRSDDHQHQDQLPFQWPNNCPFVLQVHPREQISSYLHMP